MKPNSIIATSWVLVLFLCTSQKFVSVVLSEDSAVSMLDNYVHLARDQGNNRTNNVETIFTAIGIAASLITIAEVINRRILPQPTTLLDTLDVVRRLEDLVIPDDGRQYKDAEDTILRGLYDMSVMTTNNSSEFQTLWWLDRARYLDGEIILLMEGLLGQQVAGSDLMDNIQDNLKCDAIQISEKLKRYNDLIESGSIAFNYFSGLGNMPAQEVSRRKAAMRERNIKILARNEQLIGECFQRQLSQVRSESMSTEEVSEQVAQVISTRYPLPTRWIVAVYTDDRDSVSRAAIKPIKPKLSANFNIKNVNGFHVALFPFLEGKMPHIIDGRRVDEFCARPVKGAGQMPTCDVGSTDGEYVYDELRRLGIVPDPLDLIVVPTEGQLSVRTVPLGSLPPFFAKNYPDFNIIVF
ncbi:uncharacterized protein LOC124194530 [Daphnia pulex]|uniref:uncharacterized protein LOC124194530 n=1 Tax=Daphnia pulex TaxID=6669 RepID=UPI001EDD40A8|nr:uncharacterized protein LOC124194530 [Daphnia pulex]XP_046444721.1 uncharacterized protein LOC124194530 [Daphnia pulex]XP_046444722.1 uncharacterized protein LOC124194530 [Daphnia pulex]